MVKERKHTSHRTKALHADGDYSHHLSLTQANTFKGMRLGDIDHAVHHFPEAYYDPGAVIHPHSPFIDKLIDSRNAVHGNNLTQKELFDKPHQTARSIMIAGHYTLINNTTAINYLIKHILPCPSWMKESAYKILLEYCIGQYTIIENCRPIDGKTNKLLPVLLSQALEVIDINRDRSEKHLGTNKLLDLIFKQQGFFIQPYMKPEEEASI